MTRSDEKLKGKVKIVWSSDFAYALGLIATDGCLTKGKQITFSSKDRGQIHNFLESLRLNTVIGKNISGLGKISLRVQFSDKNFYLFLKSIGITEAKSKTLGKLIVPEQYFFDFLRGCFDGDGTVYAYWDKRWKNSFMFYISFASASCAFITWLRNTIFLRCGIKGHLKISSVYQLTYAKAESLKLIAAMYRKSDARCLSRKKLKINRILSIVGKQINNLNARMVELADTLP